MNANVELVTAGPVSYSGVVDSELEWPLDIADALDLVICAGDSGGRDDTHLLDSDGGTSNIGRYAHGGEPRGIVGKALSMAHVAVADLELMQGQSLRQLYHDARLPIPITLGALVVLDAAQRSEDRHGQVNEIVEDATAAAARFLDLVSVIPAVWPEPTEHDVAGQRCEPARAGCRLRLREA